MRALLAAAVLILPFGGLADAHIHLTNPLSRTDLPTGDQKAQHCGAAVGRTARVTMLQPGATITVTWDETIQHPGYFRIAFQPDGEVFPIPPMGNGPPAGFPDQDLTGMTDPVTGAMILADRILDGTLSSSVTLPNMECNNCTLQFIQVMTDKPPYTIDINSDDIYFNCADVTLSTAAPPPADGTPVPGADAGVEPPGGNGGDLGGCSATNTSSGGILIGLAALLLRRRSRSRR